MPETIDEIIQTLRIAAKRLTDAKIYMNKPSFYLENKKLLEDIKRDLESTLAKIIEL
jgi:hypothetical protein